ncbi:NAD(P)-binding domain-containing protein, partial [Acidovorax sp. NPDC077664]
MKTIGIIGLGNMGRGMALSLQRGGYEVVGTDAASAVRAQLAADGIRVVDSIGEVVAAA